MNESQILRFWIFDPGVLIRQVLLVCAAFLIFVSALFAQTEIGSVDDKTITIGSAPEEEVIALAKKVIVKKQARGVLVFGGEAVIEGDVSGDVAVIGGSVIQRQGALIGGDVMVIGGSYQADDGEPRRGEGSQTLVFAGYEKELRAYAQDPSLLFSPS